jgi:predicted Zn-dependent protease
MEVIEQALKRHPDNLKLRAFRAGLLLMIHRPREALHDLDQLVQSVPQATGLHLGRGEALIGLRKWEEARAAFEQVSRNESAHPLALMGLARIWAHQHAPRKAMLILGGLAARTDEPHDIRLLRAQLWLELNQPLRALPIVTRVLNANPKDACALATKGNALSLLGHHRAGLRLLDRSLRWDPDNSTLHHCRAHILLKLKRPAAATKAFSTSIRLRLDQIDSPRDSL